MKLKSNPQLRAAIKAEVRRLIEAQRREATYDTSKMTNTQKAQLLRKMRDDMRGSTPKPERDKDKIQVISTINHKRMAVFSGLDRHAQNRIGHKLKMEGYKFMWRGVPPGTPVTFEGSEAQIIQHIKDQYRKVGQSF